MTLSKEDKSQSFGCCKAETISSVENSVTDVETIENCTGNNNSMFHSTHLEKNEYSFPRRIPVDVEFQDIKYTVGKFSFSKRKYGKYKTLFYD